MQGSQSWREMAAGFTFAALVAGTSVAQDLPAPSYGFSPVPAVTPAVNEAGMPGQAACPQCNEGYQTTYCEGSFWERWQMRKWEKKRRHQYAWWGYPEEFCEQPLGMALDCQFNTQIANGIAAKLVLYQFDFLEDGSRLNAKGQQQLAKHAAAMNGNLFPLVIEQTPDEPELDAARRAAVQQALTQSRFPISFDRIVVGTPTAVGLPGQQATGLNANLLRDTQNGVTNLAPGNFRAGGSILGTGTSGAGGSGSGTGGAPR